MLALPGPRVFGATPLDHVAMERAPTRGASFPTLHNEKRGLLCHSNASLGRRGYKVLREGAKKNEPRTKGFALGSLLKRDRTARGGQ